MPKIVHVVLIVIIHQSCQVAVLVLYVDSFSLVEVCSYFATPIWHCFNTVLAKDRDDCYYLQY